MDLTPRIVSKQTIVGFEALRKEALSLKSNHKLPPDVIERLFESMLADKATAWTGGTTAKIGIMRYNREVRSGMVARMLTVFDGELLIDKSVHTYSVVGLEQ